MKKKMKPMLTFLLLLALSAALCGCGMKKSNDPQMNVSYGQRDDGSSYAVYDGEAQQFFEVAEGKDSTVDVAVKKEAGVLRMLIHKENDPDAIVYDGHDFPMEHFTVTVKEPGRYRILVHAEKFFGAYSFSYDMEQ